MNLEILNIFVPFLTYILGYFISHFTIDEIKGKKTIFVKLFITIQIILILLVFYYVLIFDNILVVLLSILFFTSILLFVKKKYFKNIDYVYSLAVGIILGNFYTNIFVVLLISILLFFKSNYDYLNKKSWKVKELINLKNEKLKDISETISITMSSIVSFLFSSDLLESFLIIVIAFISLFLNNTFIIYFAVSLLFRLLLK